MADNISIGSITSDQRQRQDFQSWKMSPNFRSAPWPVVSIIRIDPWAIWMLVVVLTWKS